jgi:hypothetical protein
MTRPEDVQADVRRDLRVFEAARPQGTGGVICDPQLEIEAGCEAVVVFRDGGAVLATIERLTPKQLMARVGSREPQKMLRDQVEVLRVVGGFGRPVARMHV